MSVLITGLDMPKSCVGCIFEYGDVCYVNLKTSPKGRVTQSCPLIPIPDHGDLVDRDELMMKMWEASAYAPNHCSWVNARVVFAKDIEDAPVVIPAEKSKASLCICDNCAQRNDKGCSVCKYINEGSEG